MVGTNQEKLLGTSWHLEMYFQCRTLYMNHTMYILLGIIWDRFEPAIAKRLLHNNYFYLQNMFSSNILSSCI